MERCGAVNSRSLSRTGGQLAYRNLQGNLCPKPPRQAMTDAKTTARTSFSHPKATDCTCIDRWILSNGQYPSCPCWICFWDSAVFAMIPTEGRATRVICGTHKFAPGSFTQKSICLCSAARCTLQIQNACHLHKTHKKLPNQYAAAIHKLSSLQASEKVYKPPPKALTYILPSQINLPITPQIPYHRRLD